MTQLCSIALENVAIAIPLALVVWGLTRVLKNPPVAHILWVLVLVKLVTPPLVHFDIPNFASAPVQGGNGTAPDASPAVPAPLAEDPRLSTAPSSTIARGEAEPDRAVDRRPSAAQNDAKRPLPARLRAALAAAWSTMGPLVIWIWVGGACLVALLVAIRIVRFHRVLKGTLPASQRLQSAASELADRMGLRRPPNVRVVDSAVAPLLWWDGRQATVVLPLGLVGALDDQQIAMVLAHELAHLRRRDHWVRLLELVVSVLHWWNPLVWWVRRQLHAVEEQCCDAWVAWLYPNCSHDYAESLLKAAEISPHRLSLPALGSPFLHTYALKERIEMVLKNTSRRTASHRAAIALLLLAAVAIPAGVHFGQTKNHDAGTVVSSQIQLATVEPQTVTLTQRYVGQIHSHRHIDIRALQVGYLEATTIKEGQQVKAGDVLFKVIPILYQKRADAEAAEARVAQLEYNYAKVLSEKKVISDDEVKLLEAKLAKANAKADLAKAELEFASVRAPFNGIVNRLPLQQGSLVQQGETLTTLSDNSLMRVYFNVPEARYLDFRSADLEQHKDDLKIELVLANGAKFDQPGKLAAISADFNNQSGNIPFRADFPNPKLLLRNGQTGTILISRVQKEAIAIPQRATFEVLGKRYVYVVDKDGVAHQREIVVENDGDLGDLFVVKSGVAAGDKIVIDGIRQVRDGQKVE